RKNERYPDPTIVVRTLAGPQWSLIVYGCNTAIVRSENNQGLIADVQTVQCIYKLSDVAVHVFDHRSIMCCLFFKSPVQIFLDQVGFALQWGMNSKIGEI